MFRNDKKCPNKSCGITFEKSRFDTYRYCPHCGTALRGPQSGRTGMVRRDGGTWGLENVVDVVLFGDDGRPKYKISTENGNKSKFDKFLDDHEAGLSVAKED